MEGPKLLAKMRHGLGGATLPTSRHYDVVLILSLYKTFFALISILSVIQHYWMTRICMILGIETCVTNHIVDVPVMVDISTSYTVPPSRILLQTTQAGYVDQLAALIAKELHWTPLLREKKVNPTVSISVRPQGPCHHSCLLQPRSDSGRGLHEPDFSVTGFIQEQMTRCRNGVITRNNSPSDK